MSRFIRTKDGIFEVRTISDEPIIDFDGKPDYDDTRAVYTTTDERHTYYYGEDVIKEADTIEELCDGYYLYNGYDDKFNPDRIYTTDEKTKALDDCKDLAFYIDLMCRGRYICELRAFIETDKGLIFIGKFNEKGDLELI